MLVLTLLLFLATLSALNCGGRKSSKKSQNTAASQTMTIPRSVSSETASTAKKSQARTPLTPQTPLSEDEAVRQTEKDQDYIPPKDSMTYVKSTDTLKKAVHVDMQVKGTEAAEVGSDPTVVAYEEVKGAGEIQNAEDAEGESG